jgi:hypothetical protein
VEFKFKKASCVVVGTFNVHIIEPSRLVEMGVIDSRPKFLTAFRDISQPGMKFEIDGATWIVRPERLGIESENPKVNCGELAARTLEKLCWTPVKAVGTNIEFIANECSESDLPEHFRPVSPPIENVEQRSCHIGIRRDDSILNIQIHVKEKQLELHLNTHTDIKLDSESTKSGNDQNKQLSLNAVVCHACSRFFEDCTDGIDYVKRIIPGAVFHGYENSE